MNSYVENLGFFYQNGLIDIPFYLDLIIRVLISCVAGAVVGYERKRRQKEAGIRTHCMVALGACLFAIVSKYGYFDVVGFDSINLDASRISANIVTGVSFLGAGMIFVRSKTISGLTTAAGIWAVSSIGLSFGTGLYSLGILGTLLISFLQYVLHKPLVRIEGSSVKEMTYCISDGDDNICKLIDFLHKFDSNMYLSAIEKRQDGSYLIKANIRVEYSSEVYNIYKVIEDNPYIISITT